MTLERFEERLDRVAFALSKPSFFLILLLLGLSFFLLKPSDADPDLFARLAVGKLIESSGGVVATDPFAFSPKKEVWIDHEWLSGVVFYIVHKSLGESGLFILKIVLVVLTVVLLATAQRIWLGRLGLPELLFSILLLGDSSYLWGTTIRSHLFTFLALSYLFLAIVWSEKRKSNLLLWGLPILMVVWCNSHGGFVVGLGLLGIYLVYRLQTKRSLQDGVLPIFILTLLATGVNPYGMVAYWQFILGAVSMERPSIAEWQPVLPNSLVNLIPYVFVAIALIRFFQVRDREWWVGVFLIVTFIAGIRHERLLAINYFVILVLLGDALRIFSKLANPVVQRASTLALCGGVIALFSNLVVFIFSFPSYALSYEPYPVKALDWLKAEGNGGNLLVDFNSGSFAIWKLYPKYRVSLDGRYEEVYFEETLSLVNEAFDCKGQGWERALRHLAPDYALVPNDSKCWSEARAVADLKLTNLYQDDKWRIIGVNK